MPPGRVVVGARFVAAEVMRKLADRNLRADISPAPLRSYPPLG